VALWSSISLLFATGFESLEAYVAFRRLARIPVEFEYEADHERAERHEALKRA
jgi:hypothetical protein